jgi:isoleucyl-tRNA synthetase
VHWLPEHIKEGRFGDFLANNVDWALSRERFWGTPLNVWVCTAGRSAPARARERGRDRGLSPGAFDHFHAARRSRSHASTST